MTVITLPEGSFFVLERLVSVTPHGEGSQIDLTNGFIRTNQPPAALLDSIRRGMERQVPDDAVEGKVVKHG